MYAYFVNGFKIKGMGSIWVDGPSGDGEIQVALAICWTSLNGQP